MFINWYVDDTFLLFRWKHHIEKFRNYLNRQHKKIRFTFEIENKTPYHFLRLRWVGTITNSRLHFIANWPSAEFIPTLEASSRSHISITCYLPYCTGHWALLKFWTFSSGIWKAKDYFWKNGYPKSFVDICIRKYFDIVFIKKEVVLKSSKKELICILPFIGNKSLQLRIRSVNSIENKAWLAHLISRFACKARVIVHASLSPPVSRIKIVATKTKYQIIK